MTLFSDTLKKQIDQCGMTVYQLAKISCVDRTIIQKSMTGDRIPNQEAIQKLRKALKLSPKEEAVFLEHYEMTKMGESLFLQRKNTLQFLNAIGHTYQVVDEIKALPVKTLEFEEHSMRDVECFNSELQVQKLVQTMIEEVVFRLEEKQMMIYLPFEFVFFYDLLKQYFLDEHNQFEILNVFPISKEGDGIGMQVNSLSALETILPFLMTKKSGYYPYVYYDHQHHQDLALIFPYYFITENKVAVIAADFKKALLYTHETVISAYNEAFSILKKRCRLLTSKCSQRISYAGELAIMNRRTAFFEPLPCLDKFCSRVQIEKLVISDCEQRETVIEFIHQFFQQYADSDRKRRCYFSIKSLRQLAETGSLINFPAPVVRPLDKHETAAYFALLLEELEAVDAQLFAIRENVLKQEGAFELNLIESSDVLIRFYHREKALLNSVLIDERNISQMIIDFFEFLPDSKWICTTKEIKDEIKGLITGLQASKNEEMFC